MLGGAIWCLGNSLTVSIVKTLGLGMGLLIWGLSNMVMGWATGRFGLYDLTVNSVSNPTLNLVGILVAVAAMGVFSFVQPTLAKAGASKVKGSSLLDGDEDGEAAYAGLYSSQVELGVQAKPLLSSDGESAAASGEEQDWTDKLTDGQKKVYGVVASIVAG